MKSWQYIRTEQEVKFGCRTMQQKTYQKLDGKEKVADIAGEDGLASAFVIALTPSKDVIIARQFRCCAGRVLDELPGGLVDPGETPDISAERELREEVGYTSDNIEFIGTTYTDAWDTLTRHYYIAHDCYPVDTPNPDEDEEIEVAFISIEQLYENARTMQMIDVQALFLAHDKLVEMKGNK